jgi:putative nucleotidyltransferase with HDIG domain
MKKSVLIYVYSLVAASAAALALAYMIAPSVKTELLVGSSLLTLIGFLGAWLGGYRIKQSSGGEVSFIPYLSAIVLYPSWTTVALVGIGAAISEATRKKSGVKRAFNVAQLVLAASAATWVYTALGGQSLQVDKDFNALPHTAAVVAFLIVNTVSVATAISLAEEKPLLKTWYEGNVAGLAYDLVAIPFVYGCARAYVDWGGWGFLVLILVVVGIRFTYQSTHQLRTTNRELLELFVHTVEFRDPYTSGHSQRVSRYSRIIARAVGLSTKDIDRIGTAALLHDVGKIHEVFAPILSKPGRLTPEERAIMELHPVKSAELVAKISDLQDIIPAVRHHHENWDGTGYPDRLKGREIPLGSRIIMFADTIDAMTTDRPYRKALTENEVRDELVKFRGKQFDPDICDALLSSAEYHEIFTGADTRSMLSFTQILERARRPKTPAVA